MMKKIVLSMAAVFLSIAIYSQARMPVKEIKLKGRIGTLSSNSVRVNVGVNNTLTTTFYKSMDNVTVTVRKEDGEIVSIHTMNVKELETFNIEINDFAPGKYVIGIDAPEGCLEGSFEV